MREREVISIGAEGFADCVRRYLLAGGDPEP
jgi:hypothetical protein